jgi:hypothetical protein
VASVTPAIGAPSTASAKACRRSGPGSSGNTANDSGARGGKSSGRGGSGFVSLGSVNGSVRRAADAGVSTSFGAPTALASYSATCGL